MKVPQLNLETRSSLLMRAVAQDEAAWRRIVELYGPLIVSWCRRRGLSDGDSQEVGQEVFLTLAKSLRDFSKRESRDSFRAWLAVVTRSRIADFYRRRHKSPAGRGGSTADQFLQEAADPLDDTAMEEPVADRQIVLRRALDLVRGDFDEQTWKAFWSTAVESKDAVSVAANLGVSANAVRKSKARVLRRLKDELEGLYD